MMTSEQQSLETSSDLPTKNSHSIRSLIFNVIKASVTFGILAFLYARGMLDFSKVQKVITHPPVVFSVLFILITTNFAAVIRWQMLLRGQNLPIRLWDAIRLNMIGVFFNTAIPGAVSGDLIKGYYVVRKQPEQKGKIRAFTTLFMDRLLGLSALICVSFFSMLINYKEMLSVPQLKPLCGLIAALWFGVVVFYSFVLVEFSFTERLRAALVRLPFGEVIGRLFEAVKAYENCKRYILKGLFLSILIHCSLVGAFILIAQVLGGFESVPVDKFFFLAPMGLLVTAIPIAPAGLGTGHAAFLGLFQLVGSRSGADLFTAYVMFQICFSLVGGIFYLKYKQ